MTRRNEQIAAFFLILLSLWLLWGEFAVGVEPIRVPETRPSTRATTTPDPDLVDAKMSINNVELQYVGPVRVSEDYPAIVSISIHNMQDANVYMTNQRMESRLCFVVCVTSPKGKSTSFLTHGIDCEQAGGGILMLRSGKRLEECLDLAGYLNDGPGEYSIVIKGDYNDVLRFPCYGLEIPVPLVVVPTKAAVDEHSRSPVTQPTQPHG